MAHDQDPKEDHDVDEIALDVKDLFRSRELSRLDLRTKQKKVPAVFAEELDRRAAEARSRVGYAEPGALQLRPTTDAPPAEGRLARLGEHTPEDRKLAQIRELVAEQKYSQALNLLREFHAEHPDHPEASYLTAHCYYQLQELREALRALAPLRCVTLHPALAVEVSKLRPPLRARLGVEALIKTAQADGEVGSQEVVRSNAELVKLDPEVSLFHFLLAGSLLLSGALDAAQEAIEDGLREGKTQDGVSLERLRDEILRRRCEEVLRPARDLFRKGSYREARRSLRKVPKEFRDVRLYITFDGYLGRLVPQGLLAKLRMSRPAEPAQATPPGSPKSADELYLFLVGDEVRTGSHLLRNEQYSESERVLRAALSHCEGFPYANFLLAAVLHSGFGDACESKQLDSPEAMIKRLREIAARAQIGESDPDVAATAKTLRTVTEEALQQAEMALSEGNRINDLVEEFNAIKKIAEGGAVAADLGHLDHRLASLEQNLKAAKPNVKQPQGRQVLRRLHKAIRDSRKQIKELLLVEEVGRELQAIRNSAKGGISSEKQLKELAERLRKLSTKIDQCKGRVTDEGAKKTLVGIRKAVDGDLSQLRSFDHEVLIVNRHYKRMNDAMKNPTMLMEGGGPQKFFANIARDVLKDRAVVSSPEAQRRLDELLKAIAQVLGQVR